MRESIHPETRLGAVYLTVSSLARSLDWYENSLGFRVHRRDPDEAWLGAGRRDLLVLQELPGARRVRGTSGLYHFALLVPSRLQLGQVLRRIAETRTPVEGIVDHHLSEAIYLPDPDGNGIEVYADRPRALWPQMMRLARERGNGPMDVEGILAEVARAEGPWSGLDPGTVIGHIHLHVAGIPAAAAFYDGVLGFDQMMAGFIPTAGFVSAGGYHHHIGYNTWAGVGAPRPPPDAVGLRWFEICLPDHEALAKVVARIREAGLPLDEGPRDLFVRDPSHNGMALKVIPSEESGAGGTEGAA